MDTLYWITPWGELLNCQGYHALSAVDILANHGIAANSWTSERLYEAMNDYGFVRYREAPKEININLNSNASYRAWCTTKKFLNDGLIKGKQVNVLFNKEAYSVDNEIELSNMVRHIEGYDDLPRPAEIACR